MPQRRRRRDGYASGHSWLRVVRAFVPSARRYLGEFGTQWGRESTLSPSYERTNVAIFSVSCDLSVHGSSTQQQAPITIWRRLTTARCIVAYDIGAAPPPAGLLR